MSEEKLSPNDLASFPTTDLINELMERCSPAIFIGTKYEGETNNRSFKNFQNYNGNLETCRGMCHEMDSFLQRLMVRQEYEREIE